MYTTPYSFYIAPKFQNSLFESLFTHPWGFLLSKNRNLKRMFLRWSNSIFLLPSNPTRPRRNIWKSRSSSQVLAASMHPSVAWPGNQGVGLQYHPRLTTRRPLPMQIGEASRQQEHRPDEAGASSHSAPTHSVPRVASPPGRAPLKSKTRWAACGKCVACTRSDCGDCINCADKAKFGGSGVRKQSCVRRRCMRMNASNAAARHQPSHRGRFDTHPERRGQDVAFWDAVAGCAARRLSAPPHP